MDDAFRVRAAERVSEPDTGLEHTSEAKAAPHNVLVEALTLDELHGEKADAVGILDRVKHDDIGMAQRGDHPRLALEARQPIGVRRNVGRQHLERNLAAESRVLRAVDLSHAAAA